MQNCCQVGWKAETNLPCFWKLVAQLGSTNIFPESFKCSDPKPCWRKSWSLCQKNCRQWWLEFNNSCNKVLSSSVTGCTDSPQHKQPDGMRGRYNHFWRQTLMSSVSTVLFKTNYWAHSKRITRNTKKTGNINHAHERKDSLEEDPNARSHHKKTSG